MSALTQFDGIKELNDNLLRLLSRLGRALRPNSEISTQTSCRLIQPCWREGGPSPSGSVAQRRPPESPRNFEIEREIRPFAFQETVKPKPNSQYSDLNFRKPEPSSARSQSKSHHQPDKENSQTRWQKYLGRKPGEDSGSASLNRSNQKKNYRATQPLEKAPLSQASPNARLERPGARVPSGSYQDYYAHKQGRGQGYF